LPTRKIFIFEMPAAFSDRTTSGQTSRWYLLYSSMVFGSFLGGAVVGACAIGCLLG